MNQSPDASLSFLDVLACALGGSALLFLILTTLPHTGANAPKASDSLTASTVEVTPALSGAPAPAPPKLFRIELPENCQLGLENQEVTAAVLGEGNTLSERNRPEYWLRLGPRDDKPVSRITLMIEQCPEGEHFVIRAVRYAIPLDPIAVEIMAGGKRLVYNSKSKERWVVE